MSAIRKYRQFHGHDPRNIRPFHGGFTIPDVAVRAGTATQVLYRSDKLNPSTGEDEGWIDYFHDHHAGVGLFRCDARGRGEAADVPSWIHGERELTLLGFCLGLRYRDDGGKEHRVPATKPLPELYCIPSGRALLVVQGKRRVICMMWGGKLGVEPRGIVY